MLTFEMILGILLAGLLSDKIKLYVSLGGSHNADKLLFRKMLTAACATSFGLLFYLYINISHSIMLLYQSCSP